MPLYSMHGYMVHAQPGIPGLEFVADQTMVHDITISRAPVSSGLGWTQGRSRREISLDQIRVYVSRRLRLFIRNGSEIVYEVNPEIPPSQSLSPFVRASWPSVVLQRGGVFVHAAAVNFGPGGAALFIAPSGIGKSTLAVALVQRGYGYLADDRCCLDLSGNRFRVLPWEGKASLTRNSLEKLGLATIVSSTPQFKLNIPCAADPFVRPEVTTVFFLSRTPSPSYGISHLDELTGTNRFLSGIPRRYRMTMQTQADEPRKQALSAVCGTRAFLLSVPNNWQDYEFILQQVADTMGTQQCRLEHTIPSHCDPAASCTVSHH